jgi:hypothetical protein
MNLRVGEGRCALPCYRTCWGSWNSLRRAGVAAGPYAEIFYMLCRRTTPDPSTRFEIRYRRRKRCSACARTFSKLSTFLVTDTKSLRRGGPLCPPALPDMLAVLESVTAGRRGSRPLRENFLHAVPSRSAGYVGRNGIRYGGPAW